MLRRVVFALCLIVAALAGTAELGAQEPDVIVDPQIEEQWARAWQDGSTESIWCGYGMVRQGDIYITNTEPPEIRERKTTGVWYKPCPLRNENAHLVATIHTHPSLTQIRRHAGIALANKVRDARKRLHPDREAEYGCHFSVGDKETFKEAQHRTVDGVKVPLPATVVVCAPNRYAYRTAERIYEGEPTIVEVDGDE